MLALLASNGSDRLWKLSGEGGLVPAGVTLLADDAKGTLDVQGPEEAVRGVVRVLSEFDVQPILISAVLDFSNRVHRARTVTEISNNSKWQITDAATGVVLSIKPRLNQDRTITAEIEIESEGAKQRMMVRSRVGQELKLRIQGSSISSGPGSDQLRPTEADARFAPTDISIRLELEDQSGSGKGSSKGKVLPSP
ncbi:MAG TPA: hypothetical protein VEX38_05305 [Fimbriimonadaceae bacterium]|nr:hypothetical protein [Fimbriimonadaceae bacterium]